MLPFSDFPDSHLPFTLDTDASAEGIGAMLSQAKEGKEYVLAYYSSKFSKPERNYCVTRKELLAIVTSTRTCMELSSSSVLTMWR